jgi:hypothetical protein
MHGMFPSGALPSTTLSGGAAVAVHGGLRTNSKDALARYIAETRPELAVKLAVG